MQEVQVGSAHVAPGRMGGTWVIAVAILPASEETRHLNPVTVEKLHYLKQVYFSGVPLQAVSAAISTSRINNSGIPEHPKDLGQVVCGNTRLGGEFPS
ncbi:MAG TPA: hypothetical protein VKB88_16485 [Bryobacteraceae bacterium]|nr:hypothetical protein [Bryobacteraceae bacterium]